MRFLLPFAALLALAACDTSVPDDGAGMGALNVVEEEATSETDENVTDDQAPEDTENTEVVINTDNPTISDTQDFGQLSQRESIESDAARLKAQKEKFQVIAPTALPSRTGSGGSSVAQYALSTTHSVGEQQHKRFNPIGSRNACSRYTSDDEAQETFLKSGGPRRDPKNLDPDGDGFACGWSPEVYRAAVK